MSYLFIKNLFQEKNLNNFHKKRKKENNFSGFLGEFFWVFLGGFFLLPTLQSGER
jgi:hypothetical protein